MNDVPSTRPYFHEEDIPGIQEDIAKVLRSGRLILGPYTRAFEATFKDYIGVKHAVAVSSCTAALEIALRFFQLSGGEVIVPTNTFVATANAVTYAGGQPVLADINPETLCLDPKDAAKRITPRTKGIIAVHIAGLISSEIEDIKSLCQNHGLFFMEDVAHAAGATTNGKKAGSLADAGCFSFYPTKVMTTGAGGMVTTNDDSLADYAFSLRHHGVGKDLNDIVNPGNDWLMDEVRAVLGTYQLKRLEENLARRNHVAERYNELLKPVEGVKTFPVPPGSRHSYYKYPVLLARGIDKKKLEEILARNYKIGTGSVYDPPVHLHPLYRKTLGYREGNYPAAEETLRQLMCLPVFAQMTDAEVDFVVEAVRRELPNCTARA